MRERNPLVERFWQKVDKNGPAPTCRPELGPCWLWLAALNGGGYGQFWIDGQIRRYVHRISWELEHGPSPEGMDLDHRCRVRRCVNPAHLEPVTHAENVRRGDSPAMSRARQLAKTHCPRGHSYSGDNLYVKSKGWRNCRTCHREAMRRHRQTVGTAERGAAQ